MVMVVPSAAFIRSIVTLGRASTIVFPEKLVSTPSRTTTAFCAARTWLMPPVDPSHVKRARFASAPPPLVRVNAASSPTPPFSTSRAPSLSVMMVAVTRSEEHTSELQSLMRISYAVFCLKKKNQQNSKSNHHNSNHHVALLSSLTHS